MLEAAPTTAAAKGELTIQPAYFTSSLFVDALRQDVLELGQAFSAEYLACRSSSKANGEHHGLKPFDLFKSIWIRDGWKWLHLKVLEPRARETFVDVVLRILLELAFTAISPVLRVAGLFGLFTFFETQPSTSTPRISYKCKGIPVPSDVLESLRQLPHLLSGENAALKPYVALVLSKLEPTFYILPPSSFMAQNPSVLPREQVRSALPAELPESAVSGAKKAGRRSKAEKAHQLKTGTLELANWLERTSIPTGDVPGRADPAGAGANEARMSEQLGQGTESVDIDGATTTHSMLLQRPFASLVAYRAKKSTAVSGLESGGHHAIVDRAGRQVLHRLRELDASTAEHGPEVCGERGELYALGRVERAVESQNALHLLEGAGL